MRFAMLLACALAFAAQAQTMYKWVDEKGVTHYSEKPPEGAKATKVEIKVEPGKPASPDDWKIREQQWRQQRVEKDRSEREQSAARERAAEERQARCKRAQQALDRLRNVGRLYELNAKGERVFIEDRERPALMEKWQREADEACR